MNKKSSDVISKSCCNKFCCNEVKANMSCVMRKPGFLTRSDTNQAIKSQEMARGLKSWTEKEEGLYYL